MVLSRKAVIEEENTGRKDQTLLQIEEDIVVEGQIKNLTDYGAFVDLGGVDGLLHVTDMSWGRLAESERALPRRRQYSGQGSQV